MAKAKATKSKGIQHKHLHSRISYLYQAATYLSLHTHETGKQLSAQAPPAAIPPAAADSVTHDTTAESDGQQPQPLGTPRKLSLARLYASHLRDVSLKSQIRLSPDIKRSLCRRCNTVLIPQVTSTSRVENHSRGGKKPWADVLVVRCNACRAEKRFPTGSKRQKRRTERVDQVEYARGRGGCYEYRRLRHARVSFDVY